MKLVIIEKNKIFRDSTGVQLTDYYDSRRYEKEKARIFGTRRRLV